MCLPCSSDDLTPVHNLISFSDDINYWMSTNLLNRAEQRQESCCWSRKSETEFFFFFTLIIFFVSKLRIFALFWTMILVLIIILIRLSEVLSVTYQKLENSQTGSGKLVLIVKSRSLDYRNTLFAGLSNLLVVQFQLAQNATVRVLMHTQKFEHILHY